MMEIVSNLDIIGGVDGSGGGEGIFFWEDDGSWTIEDVDVFSGRIWLDVMVCAFFL